MDISCHHGNELVGMPMERNRLQHRKRSSSLVALDSLGLPSPPTSPLTDVFDSATSSGEIPIIFAFLTTNSAASAGDKLPQVTGGLRPVLPPLAKFSPMSAFFPMHDSAISIDTQAFGGCSEIKCTSSSDDESGASSPTSPAELLQSPSEYDIGSEDYSPVVQVFDYDAEHRHLGERSDFTISAYLASPSICDDATSAFHSAHPPGANDTFSDTWTAKFGREWSLGKQLDMNATIKQSINKSRPGHSLTSIQTSWLAPSSTLQDRNTLSAPTTPEFDDKTPTQSTFLKNRAHVDSSSDAACHDPFSGSSFIQCSPSTCKIETHGHLEELTEAATDACQQEFNGTDEEQIRSLSKEVPPNPNEGPKLSFLPMPSLKHARWLRDTLVELWIDQEGFRAVRPKFYLASVSSGLPVTPVDRSTFPVGEDDPLYTTVAEFLPVKRISYPFHHAPLDRTPCLTRVAVAGDEARDFVTRTGSLPLREDGVFFVSGTEDARIEPGRIVRLAWRFEYFIAHRIPASRGRGGERLLTPLSFSCTPALLDRSRAHKVTVLHIMKKTVLPNIVAQKLEPPDIPVRLPASNSCGSEISPEGDLGSPVRSKRKTSRDSEESEIRGDELTPKRETFVPPRLKSPPRPPLRYTKHRRGSHSDPNAVDAAQRKCSQRGHARSVSLSDQDTIRASSRPLIGPIIPRRELMKMFDSDDEKIDKNERRRPESLRFEIIDNVQVTLLPAPPRRKRS